MTAEQFVKAGNTWQERSTEAGPEYLPCPSCGAKWNPVFVAFQRTHRGDCAYVADIMNSGNQVVLLNDFTERLRATSKDLWNDQNRDLNSYIRGVEDALRVMRGERPESRPGDGWGSLGGS